ncbi:hypothetical protein HIM_06165 [Hirsutella minnesotensis 3608]|uniref:Uncharacterized protein n=1 Tax=Hirsutella minnesotensis 3608 TaxID=1043627 RepID=A0A0F8A521_9HYPO|nr:hypothetical protein HIM_06165 [Hirsutella minnesotensis 3608]
MPDPTDYTVGWICAISTEFVAAQAFLDEEHDRPESLYSTDNNNYALGRIGKHNIVIAVLPDGEYGTSSAAIVARDMLHSFPSIRIGLMVGIGGGAPSAKHDIRLGDVVVSTPHDGKGGVFQYDFGKTLQEQTFRPTGFLDQPPTSLRTAVGGLKAQYERKGHQIEETIGDILEKNPRLRKKYKRPDPSLDRLYRGALIHPPDTEASCMTVCGDESNLVSRPERTEDKDNPAIHYGLIASANQLMKDALVRDKLARDMGVLCFEMEAAGLMNHFPCLVIRGICDYSDSHKNKEWQGYAAMAAAAYTKDLLNIIPPTRVEAEKRIGQLLQQFSEDIGEKVQSIRTAVLDSNQKTVLSRLPVADGASFDSHDNEHDATCLDGTRRELLEQVSQWANDSAREHIYWLQGKAGTGKSTIARTVASNLAAHDRLAASFFFKRGERDRGNSRRLFSTIAAQLAQQSPAVAEHVRHAMEADPNVTGKALGVQFEKLILQPVEAAYCDPSMAMTVVIDALDECDGDQDVKVIIYQLSRANRLTAAPLKFFVTSRFEPPIRLGFEDIHGKYIELPLHEIPKPDIERDIAAFLEFRLEQIRCQSHLLSGWPGQAQFQELLKMAIPLFIFAATACRFIEDDRQGGGEPDDRLQQILKYQFHGEFSAAYLPALNQMIWGLKGSRRYEAIEEFKIIVGSIITLANPLPAASLARLLGITAARVNNRLQRLHSVLDIPVNANAPVRLFHESFRDFLIHPDPRDEHEFCVDESERHKTLADACLQLLSASGHLKEDICGLRAPGKAREYVELRTIDSCLPSEVRYACLYWVHHLKGSGIRLDDGHYALQFLRRHFLHWLEALSLVGSISESIGLVVELQRLVDVDNGTHISKFLYDAKRFILNCRPAIEQAPLQLYSSALVFAPERSVVRERFQSHIGWITTKPILEQNWNPCLQTLDGHSEMIQSVAFSCNGQLASSSSHVKIWDAATGAPQHTLAFNDSSRPVYSVDFSRNGRLVAACAAGQEVRVWDTTTGALQRTLESYAETVAFSTYQHGQLLALGSGKDKIMVWDTATGAMQWTLRGYGCCVAFSTYNNSRLLASHSYRYTVDLWNVEKGALLRTLHHDRMVESIAFSPHDDGRWLASGSGETVNIWDAVSGTLHMTLIGHDKCVMSVAFSSNGQMLASGSEDRTVKVWDATSGQLLQTYKGHRSTVRSLAFSCNGLLLASGSEDRTVKVWDVTSRPPGQALEGHGSHVSSVVFSADGRLLASMCHDCTIKVWEAATGALQQTFKADGYNYLNSTAFSSDGRLLASCSGTVKVWDVATGALQRKMKSDSRQSFRYLVFSSDDRLIAAVLHLGPVYVWDAATGALQHKLKSIRPGQPQSLAVSCDARLIAVGSGESTIDIWDASTGMLQRTLDSRGGPIQSVAFSSDSRLLASVVCYGEPLVGQDWYHQTVTLWDVMTGVPQRKLNGYCGRFLRSTMAFTRDGLHLLTDQGRMRLPAHGDSRSKQAHAHGPARDGPEAQARLNAPTLQFSGCGLSPNCHWIRWNGSNALWVPPDYRPDEPDEWAISPSTEMIALAYRSGRVLTIGFSSTGPTLN